MLPSAALQKLFCSEIAVKWHRHCTFFEVSSGSRILSGTHCSSARRWQPLPSTCSSRPSFSGRTLCFRHYLPWGSDTCLEDPATGQISESQYCTQGTLEAPMLTTDRHPAQVYENIQGQWRSSQAEDIFSVHSISLRSAYAMINCFFFSCCVPWNDKCTP